MFKEVVHPITLLQLGNLAFRIVHIPKHDSPVAASIGTGRLELLVLNFPSFALGIQDGFLAHLYTPGAFFHDPT